MAVSLGRLVVAVSARWSGGRRDDLVCLQQRLVRALGAGPGILIPSPRTTKRKLAPLVCRGSSLPCSAAQRPAGYAVGSPSEVEDPTVPGHLGVEPSG